MDWEQQLGEFLERVKRGESAAVVCEDLIEYVQDLGLDEFAKGYVRGSTVVATLIEAPCE